MSPCNGNCGIMDMSIPVLNSYDPNLEKVSGAYDLKTNLRGDLEKTVTNSVLSSGMYHNLSLQDQHNYMMQKSGVGETALQGTVSKSAGNYRVADVMQDKYN